MPGSAVSLQRVQSRFRETLGEPKEIMGRKDHWSLTANSSMPPINVLIESSGDRGVVIWVFNPNDRRDGALRTIVVDEDELNALIDKIRAFAARGAQQYGARPETDVSDA